MISVSSKNHINFLQISSMSSRKPLLMHQKILYGNGRLSIGEKLQLYVCEILVVHEEPYWDMWDPSKHYLF